MIRLIKNIHIYAPENIGIKDILIVGDKISKICDFIKPFDQAEVIDGSQLILTPGFIDQHVHITGGGGEGGFTTRVPEVHLSELTACGITTVVGLLGTDVYTRNIENLLAKTKALNEEGITAFCLTGGYRYPSITLTGSVEKDIVFVNEILGLKLAISDHRASYISYEEFKRAATQVRLASMISNKQGYIHLHMGQDEQSLNHVYKLLEETSLPIGLFKPTHVQKIYDDALKFAQMGGMIDFTASLNKEPLLKLSHALQSLPTGHITLSSDANGSSPKWNEQKEVVGMGVSSPKTLYETIKALLEMDRTLEEVLPICTSNVAKSIGQYPNKGVIKENSDADMIFFNQSLDIVHVMAKGQFLIENNIIKKTGTFERSSS